MSTVGLGTEYGRRKRRVSFQAKLVLMRTKCEFLTLLAVSINPIGCNQFHSEKSQQSLGKKRAHVCKDPVGGSSQ